MNAQEAQLHYSLGDILPVMFKRKPDLHQTTFAMGEAVAHLHTLWFEGKLQSLPDSGSAGCKLTAAVFKTTDNPPP